MSNTTKENPHVNGKGRDLLVACNRRMHDRVAEILTLANDCLVNTVHPEGYVPGQIGMDYRTFGKTIAAIRKVCGESFADTTPDYDLLAKLLTDKDFDHDRLGRAIDALGAERAFKYPTFYTPGWLCDLVKRMPTTVGCPSLVPGHIPSGADGTEPAPSAIRHVGKKWSTKTDDHITVVGRFDERAVVAEAEFAHPAGEDSPCPNVYGEGFVATVTRTFEDGTTKPFCKIDFADAGSVVCEKMLWGVVKCVMSYYGHRARIHANRRAAKIAALSPDAELAATVARQQDDDDLAQRIENA